MQVQINDTNVSTIQLPKNPHGHTHKRTERFITTNTQKAIRKSTNHQRIHTKNTRGREQLY